VITVLHGILGNTTAGTIIAATFSILFLAAEHFPICRVDWMDIMAALP
jgi:hypothetical protein